MKRYFTALLACFALLMGYEAMGHELKTACPKPAADTGFVLRPDSINELCFYRSNGEKHHGKNGFFVRTKLRLREDSKGNVLGAGYAVTLHNRLLVNVRGRTYYTIYLSSESVYGWKFGWMQARLITDASNQKYGVKLFSAGKVRQVRQDLVDCIAENYGVLFDSDGSLAQSWRGDHNRIQGVQCLIDIK